MKVHGSVIPEAKLSGIQKICPITYEAIEPGSKYSKKGLRQLNSSLTFLHDFPYTAEEQRKEVEAHATKLSIQGVQPKLSTILNIKDSTFEIVDTGGRYIFKPQVERYKQLPENEDVTMRLAASVGIEVPTHGLIYSKEGSLTYFIRRFDRKGQKEKIHVEDFAQLSGKRRDTKYHSSMEQVAHVLNICTFPAIEKLELFKRTLFAFLVGNEDMHLKNFSIIVREDKISLSPAYDMVNTTLALTSAKEELALPIRGRKKNITRNDLITYFAVEHLGVSPAACDAVLHTFQSAIPSWKHTIARSFLSPELQKKYLAIIQERTQRLGLPSE